MLKYIISIILLFILSILAIVFTRALWIPTTLLLTTLIPGYFLYYRVIANKFYTNKPAKQKRKKNKQTKRKLEGKGKVIQFPQDRDNNNNIKH